MNILKLRQIIKEELKKTKLKSVSDPKRQYKVVKKSDKYKYIYLVKSPKTHKELWVAKLGPKYNPTVGLSWIAYFDNEKDAALAVDKKLIAAKKEPVNILKRK